MNIYGKRPEGSQFRLGTIFYKVNKGVLKWYHYGSWLNSHYSNNDFKALNPIDMRTNLQKFICLLEKVVAFICISSAIIFATWVIG